jgi:hypothetical protein
MPSIRNRLRFSVRTLAIFVAIVSIYLGAWEATKRYAVRQTPGVTRSKGSAWIDVPAGSVPPTLITVDSASPAPFVVSRYKYRFEYVGMQEQPKRYSVANGTVEYYFWFFGAEFKLPFESTW